MRISNEWLDYLERPLWSGTLGVCLMYGYTDSEFQKKRESASFDATVRAIEEKIELLGADTIHLKEYFSHVIHNGEYLYKPKVFIEWAIHRRLPVPNELKEFLKSRNETSEHVRAAMESLEAQPEPLSTYGLSEYLKHRKWTALQAIFILHGMKPQGTDENTRDELQTHFIQAYSYLEQDAFTADEGEHLKPKIIGAGVTTYCETPEFWFRWAVSKGLPIDERITKHFKTNGEQTETVAGIGKESQTKKLIKEKELKQGLREIWEKEGHPEARVFFPDKLKKYINKAGSPVTAVYTAGKNAGIDFKLSTGTTGHRTKKTISNYVSVFKKTP